ncbi:major capsid protein [uncultured marine virus]|nr:major capsid protein [uncultured marine virus]
MQKQTPHLQSSEQKTGLVADLSTAEQISVNDFRRAFALQRYQEARSKYGSRYSEYLRFLGIKSSDARLQRPEFLGGGKTTINFSEVLNTTSSVDGATPVDDLGHMGGHGIASMRSNKYRRFFEEHGHVITLMSVRPKTMYSNGLHRKFSRTTKEDYFQRELQYIGQQPIYSRENYAQLDADGGSDIFGYTDRFNEYKPSLHL